MIKEIFICLVIIISIVGLDYVTQNYTDETVKATTQILSEAKEKIENDEFEKALKKIEEIEKKWKEKEEKLAYYIEHDELEKIDSAIVSAKSYIDTENYSLAIERIQETKFILEHIDEKTSFNLQNIF